MDTTTLVVNLLSMGAGVYVVVRLGGIVLTVLREEGEDRGDGSRSGESKPDPTHGPPIIRSEMGGSSSSSVRATLTEADRALMV